MRCVVAPHRLTSKTQGPVKGLFLRHRSVRKGVRQSCRAVCLGGAMPGQRQASAWEATGITGDLEPC
eukprot:3048515-Amphidinium_carterae.1